MDTYLHLFTNIKKCVLVLVLALNVMSIYAEDDSLKLLMHEDRSLNQASGTYYWAKQINQYYNSAMGNAYGVGSTCGLTQDSQFTVELVIAGSTGSKVGVKFIPYDKNGTQLDTISVLWNTVLTTDYSTIATQFTIPAQSTYTIKDIYRLRTVIYNIDYATGAKIWVKEVKLFLDESTLLKNTYFREYEDGETNVVLKDDEWCKEFSSGYYTYISQRYISNFFDFDDSTVFEYQVKAMGTSDALLGTYIMVYDKNNSLLGSFSVIWDQALSSTTLKTYTSQFTLDGYDCDDVGSVRIYVYRSNQLGTIWFNSPSLYVDYSTVDNEIAAKEYLSGENQVELHNSEYARKLQAYYYTSVSSFPFLNDKIDDLGKSKYQLKVYACGDAELGTKIQLRDGTDILGYVTPTWGQSLTNDYQWYTGTFTIPDDGTYDDVDNIKVLFYRSDDANTLWINEFEVSLNADSIAYNERAINLSQDGFTLTDDGSILTASKTDERHYYEILSSQGSGTFKKYQYLGSTYTKSSDETDYFPIGVYIYTSETLINALATDWGVSVAEVFERIGQDVADHGCNTIYLSGLVQDPVPFELAVAEFQEKGISVFGQFNGNQYLKPENGRSYYESTTVPAIISMLPQYSTTTGILGWMGKEECDPDEVALVQDYRALCESLDPSHGTFTLHNNLTSQETDSVHQPAWLGFDIYRYRVLKSPDYGMWLSTPLDAMNRLSGEISSHSRVASKKGTPLIYVGQGYGEQRELDDATMNQLYGFGVDKMSGKSAWVETSTGVWKGWSRYIPENGMHLQTWIAIANGAKGLMLYYYFETNYSLLGLIQTKALVDDNLTESSTWLEFGNSIDAISSLVPLFSQWHIEWDAKAEADATNSKWIEINSFIREFDTERYLVIVNKRIGEWDVTSPALPSDSTDLYFDDDGLAGMSTVGALSFEVDIEGTESVWNVLTGSQLTKNSNDQYDLSLDPGRGVVLMQGTQAQLTAIRTELGL